VKQINRQQNSRRYEMFSKPKIALCVAMALGIESVPLATYAFAGNVYDSPDWAPPFYGSDVIWPAAGIYEGNAPVPAPRMRRQLNASRQPSATRKHY
jgi:hypothetical protein